MKKPRASYKKKDITDPEHDELMMWLIQNREGLVDAYYGDDEEELVDKSREALTAYRNKVNDLIEEVEAIASESGQLASVKNLARQRLKTIKTHLLVLQPEPLNEQFGRATIVEWYTQHTVNKIKHDRYGDRKEEFAGYVDLRMDIKEPGRIELTPAPRLSGPYVYQMSNILDKKEDDGEEQTSIDLKRLEDLEIDEPEWGYYVSPVTVVCDVRTRLSTYGDLLQDLKTLRELHDHEPRNVHIFLVVNNIPGEWKQIIEHEGFTVVAREEIASASE